MHKVKITVLRRTLQEDLAAEYGAEGLTRCPMLREGPRFSSEAAQRGAAQISAASPQPFSLSRCRRRQRRTQRMSSLLQGPKIHEFPWGS